MDKSVTILNALEEVSSFYKDLQKASGLNCLEGCGKCCDNPSIFARASEMLPMAEWLYREGRADETLELLLRELNVAEHKNCVFYQKEGDSNRGRCLAYEFRPLVCRSFGVFLREGKSGRREFSVCKLIKENQQDKYLERQNEIENFSSYQLVDQVSYKFYQSDIELALESEEQINISLMKALKKVIFYNELLKKESHEN